MTVPRKLSPEQIMAIAQKLYINQVVRSANRQYKEEESKQRRRKRRA